MLDLSQRENTTATVLSELGSMLMKMDDRDVFAPETKQTSRVVRPQKSTKRKRTFVQKKKSHAASRKKV